MRSNAISVLAVDDEHDALQPLSTMMRREGYAIETAADGRLAIAALQERSFDIVLLDINMPGTNGMEVLAFIKEQFPETEVIMLTGVQDLHTAVECMTHGAFYYITKPYQPADLFVLMERALERKRLRIRNRAFRTELELRTLGSTIVTRNEAFLEVLNVASRVATSDSPVLIQGASGTGKELVANHIHMKSLRKDQAFLSVNCSSLPDPLFESELFGHEKGAFTDAATAKQGLVEVADGGTLFLDEVAEMPLSIQPKLLRFLQTGEFRRVGGNKNLRSDVRILSATNRDLRREAAERRFREDLLFRLNVITLEVPPLKDRKDDIPLLAGHFLASHASAGRPKKIDDRALELLMKYHWPGNVRELENVIARCVILSQEEVIRPEDLALTLRSATASDQNSETVVAGTRAGSAVSLAEIQRAHVTGVLASVGWNKELAAKILGISLNTLYSKIRSYRISKP